MNGGRLELLAAGDHCVVDHSYRNSREWIRVLRPLVDESDRLERVHRQTGVLARRQILFVGICVGAAAEPVPDAIGSEETADRYITQ